MDCDFCAQNAQFRIIDLFGEQQVCDLCYTEILWHRGHYMVERIAS